MTANALKVAIVDDDPDDIFPIRRGLSQIPRDITVFEFLSGRSLFAHLEEPSCSGPDIILLDINMPRMNGFEVVRRLKKDARWSGIPVIMLTTSSHAVDRKRCLEAGAQDFVSKFASIDAINGWLEALIDLMDEQQSHHETSMPQASRGA